MTRDTYKILFLGKKNSFICKKAQIFLNKHFSCLTSFSGEWTEPIPKGVLEWKGDYILSLLSRWILPKKVLKKATWGAINFHPASPDYPGIGCTNFALYDGITEYGVTCHFMDEKIDIGDIIDVRAVEIKTSDTVESLLESSYETLWGLFYQTTHRILWGETLVPNGMKWGGKSRTRKELDALAIITKDMDEEEINRRKRAVTYKHWGIQYASDFKKKEIKNDTERDY